MSHTIELSDEQYQAVLRAAQDWGTTVEAYLAQVADEMSRPYYSTVDDFARALGTSEAVIEESKRLFREREGRDAKQQP